MGLSQEELAYTETLSQAKTFEQTQASSTVPGTPLKTTTSTNLIGIGGVNLLDTYLSPETYRGTELRFFNETQWRRDGKKWGAVMINQGNVSLAKNRADNAKFLTAMYDFAYGKLRNFSLADGRLRFQAGGIIDANLGVIYSTRNGNNPAQMKAWVSIGPLVAAEYDFTLWSKLFTIRYEAQAPLAGLLFSPNYGQSYYEIFSRGNYDHNIVPVTIFSQPSLRHSLTIDIPIKKSLKIRAGYMGDWQQAKVNNLKYHSRSNLFVIGITRQFKIFNL